jgi:hypothetical protein
MADFVYQEYVCHTPVLVVYTTFRERALFPIYDNMLACYKKML